MPGYLQINSTSRSSTAEQWCWVFCCSSGSSLPDVLVHWRSLLVMDLVSFLQVEAELIDKLDSLVSEGKGDENYRELFSLL